MALSTAGLDGATEPVTRAEQIVAEQVRQNPGIGEVNGEPMRDGRWPAENGWVKMEVRADTASGQTVKIHYVYNQVTGAFDDVKAKPFTTKQPTLEPMSPLYPMNGSKKK